MRKIGKDFEKKKGLRREQTTPMHDVFFSVTIRVVSRVKVVAVVVAVAQADEPGRQGTGFPTFLPEGDNHFTFRQMRTKRYSYVKSD